MPIQIKLNAPLDGTSDTALAFQAIGEGFESFRAARQQPDLPSFVLDDDQVRRFGPSSEFTKSALKILNDPDLTRPQKSVGFEAKLARGELIKEKPLTAQEELDARIVVLEDGTKGLIDKNGNFDPFRTARGEKPEDVAKQQEKTFNAAIKATDAIAKNRFDAQGNHIPATDEEVFAEVRRLERLRELAFAPAQPVVEPGGPTTGDVPGLSLAPPPDEGQIPQTPEELMQLIQVKLEEFDRMNPEQRTQTIRDMPDEEREIFLESLPQQIKSRLDRVEAKIVATKDKEKVRELTKEWLRILIEFPLFTEAAGGF